MHRFKRAVFGGTFLELAGDTPVVHLRGNDGESYLRALGPTGDPLWEIEGRGEDSYMHRLWVGEKGEGHQRMVSGTPRVVDGRLYFGSVEGREARVHVVDCESGEMLLQASVPAKLSGLGFEPSPELPWGPGRLLVGMRRSILCLEVA